MPTTLPPGLRRRDLTAALRAFAKVVGAEWVFSSEEDVALYRDAYSLLWGEPDEKVASAAVAPASTEQVVQLVQIANRFRIPMYPISTGKNLGYGGSAPVLPGSVVLDLKRMDRVLEVNERHAYAVVEPGVSYFDLYRYIQDRGLKVWLDCPGPGWGSVIGNALDRGVGYTMQSFRSHFDAHCGMEVVLPTGKVIRTGMGAMPNAPTWQQFKAGFGPELDGLFAQSNFGIVTKMGFWLMPQPEAFALGRVSVPRNRDLIPLVDGISRLENSQIVQGITSFSNPITGTDFGTGPAGLVPSNTDDEITRLLQNPAGFAPEQLEALGLRKGVPFWSCDFNMYGPRKLIEAQWSCVKDSLASIPGAQFSLGQMLELPLTPEQVEATPDTVFFGIPSLKTYGLGPLETYDGAPVVGHVFFSPVLPKTGEAVIEANAVFADIVRSYRLPAPPFLFPTSVFPRCFIFVLGLPVTRDAAINRKVRGIFKDLMEAAARHGWGEYRTAPAFYDEVANTYSFNDHALLRFKEVIKDSVDPNGILSAGRYGIWPRHLRKIS